MSSRSILPTALVLMKTPTLQSIKRRARQSTRKGDGAQTMSDPLVRLAGDQLERTVLAAVLPVDLVGVDLGELEGRVVRFAHLAALDGRHRRRTAPVQAVALLLWRRVDRLPAAVVARFQVRPRHPHLVPTNGQS